MPDETVESPQVSSEPEAEPQDGITSDNGVEAEESAPGPVNYERFKEVIDQKNQAAAEAQRAAQENRQLQAQLQQAASMIQNMQKPPAPPSVDPTEELARSKFNPDEVGQQTYEAVKAAADVVVARRLAELEPKLQEIAQREAQGVSAKIQTGFTVTNQVNQLASENNYTPEDVKKLQGRMQQMLQQPGWQQAAESNPANAMLILKSAHSDLVTEGELKPHRQPRAASVSPLQPGGNGQPPQEPKQYDPATNPLPGVRTNISKDRAQVLYDQSVARHQKAMEAS